ncbi:MAG TPA: ATP-binding protein [Caulobacteraceae bacterium]|jgi:signal transduction histidine kinase/CheY-like chemotaxis protein|nr:ATP-binding protein [Caulobacteraceae bacterium]
MDSANPKTPESTLRPEPPAEASSPVALSVQVARNLVVQGLGMAMVSLMLMEVFHWPIVVAWTLMAIGAALAEHHMLVLITRGGREGRTAARWAPALRVVTTSVYALVVFGLATQGGAGERLFAYALMSASLVHVLMRHYRAPLMLAASVVPYLAVMSFNGLVFARMAFQQGHVLAAFAPAFAVATFALQVWAARSQLANAWDDLMSARETAEERARAAHAANRAKSQFLATMSHELRTPLNGVLGMVQALTTDQLTNVQRERVKVIRRSSENLLAVLNDLLDLSKIEASALHLEVAEFDLEHLVRGVVAAYQPLAAKKAVSFTFDIADEACGYYRGDSARIRRILYSLADNAVKFTQAGGVSLTVRREDDHVVFRIVDSGVGISEDDLTHLFEGFFQADSTLARRFGGTGIGLAICRELTTLMNGSIEASSVLGKGSTFTLRLPLERVAGVAGKASPQNRAAAPEEPVSLRVLAAEDNPTNQLVLKTLLAPAGIAPSMVENGREAVAAWESQDWDIVLMDIQMPEVDGVEATRAIRRRERETGRIRTPIIAVTANAMTHQLVEYEAAGIDGVVAKPVDAANLFRAMEQALAKADEQRTAAA